jgi:hypothetical protein
MTGDQRYDYARPRRPRLGPVGWIAVVAGGVGTSAVALAAYYAAYLLFYGATAGGGVPGVPSVGLFVAGFIPLGYGLFVTWAAYNQFRLRDDEFIAPKALGALLLCPSAQVFVELRDHTGADLHRPIILFVAVAVAALLSLVSCYVVYRAR